MAVATLFKGSTVLVTGANGFIASHVADQLLEDGYNVKGTVRTLDKGQALLEHFQTKYGEGRFELVVVEDIADDAKVKAALEGIVGPFRYR